MKYLTAFTLVFFSAFAFSEESSGDLGTVFDFLSDTAEWFGNGMYHAADNLFQRIAAWVIVWMIEAKLFMLQIGMELSELFINSLGISQAINNAFNSLDSNIAALVMFLRIPEAINILLSAYTTRFVMSLI